MTDTKKETKQNSSRIRSGIRKAQFVQMDSSGEKNFINTAVQGLNTRCARRFPNLKRSLNSIVQKPALWASFIDWKVVKENALAWLVESFIEGFTANFATHFLFGMPFSIMHIFAHGFAIKQCISTYWRLRKDGPALTVPKKND